eukprot:7925659-Ditylum_brightwellii.AAC.1
MSGQSGCGSPPFVGCCGGRGGRGGAARSDASGDSSVSSQTTEPAANTSTGVLAWMTTALFNLQMEFTEASDRALLVKEKCKDFFQTVLENEATVVICVFMSDTFVDVIEQ